MGVVNSVATWFLRKRITQIEEFVKHPLEVQDQVFQNLLKTAAATEFGSAHGFGEGLSVEDYRERVPVVSYEELYPQIERILKGEKNILWPGKIKWFSKSSGTTNDRSKFIPVSKESLHGCHFKGGKDMVSVYLHNHPESKVFDGKALAIGGSHEVNKNSKGSYYGDLSAVLNENTPFFFHIMKALSKETALMSEWEEKIDRMAQETVGQNVTNLIGVPTWTLVLINKLFELRPEAGRDLSQIWPNLEVFFHGGVSFTPYREQFKALIHSPNMSYFETYNASEGFFGLQHESDKEDLLLMLDYGIFYEFIKPADVGLPHPPTLSLEEVELGKPYAMVISTNGGLWRYLIGDTVSFTHKFPFKIKVAGRVKHFINAFGEELVVENADSAISAACEATGATIEDYTACPVYFSTQDNGAHEWLIEFAQEPDNLERFRQVMDERLRAINSDYDAKRTKDIALRPPIMRKMPPGTFYQWMKARGKLGGQNKVPRLSNDRQYVESVLSQHQPLESVE